VETCTAGAAGGPGKPTRSNLGRAPRSDPTLPDGQPASPSRAVRAAGLRWPAEEDSGPGKDCFGLDQSQVRLYAAIARHTVLVMAVPAICAVTAALLRSRTDTQAPAPVLPDQSPPAEFG
jgi:hypothetical protein